MMEIEEVTMTPAQASKILRGNVKNRLVSPRRVRALAAAMTEGHWRNDGNPIKIADDGKLIDGQHRLHAVVESDVTVPMIIMTGLPEEVRMTVDSGRPRTFGDYLRMEAVPNSAEVAATTRLLYAYQSGAIQVAKQSYLADTQTLWECYQKNAELITTAIEAARTVYKMVPMPKSCLAVLWIIFNEIDAEDTAHFFAQLGLSQEPSCGPRLLLRNLNSGNPRAMSGSGHQRDSMALTIKAWNLYRSGAEADRLVWRPGGARREKFPEPK